MKHLHMRNVNLYTGALDLTHTTNQLVSPPGNRTMTANSSEVCHSELGDDDGNSNDDEESTGDELTIDDRETQDDENSQSASQGLNGIGPNGGHKKPGNKRFRTLLTPMQVALMKCVFNVSLT